MVPRFFAMVACADVVEVAPCFHVNDITSVIASRIIVDRLWAMFAGGKIAKTFI